MSDNAIVTATQNIAIAINNLNEGFAAILSGSTATYSVANLPDATSNIGVRLFVTDATSTTFASIVAGGGSDKVPVYSDGTNWRIG